MKQFLAVAESSSFNRAAGSLHVNQTTISKQIAALEQHLNATLFKRTNKGILITPEGEIVREYARAILQKEQEMMDALNQSNKERLRVGMLPSIAISLFAEALNTPLFNEFELDITTGRSSDLHQRLSEGAIDVFIGENVRTTSAKSIKLFTESFRLISSREHTNHTIGHFITNEKLITTKKPSRIRDETYNYLKAINIIHIPGPEVDSVHVAVSLVLGGIGCSIVPSSTSMRFNGTAIDIPEIKRDIYVFFHLDGVTRATKLLVDHLIDNQNHSRFIACCT